MEQKSLKEMAELIEKYDFEGSWYADYPPPGFWKNNFAQEDYKEALKILISKGEDHPISLYVHFPFCPRQCLYCVCYNEITGSHEKIDIFLEYMFKEIEMLRDFFDKFQFKPNVKLIHFGGGSPSFMTEEQIGKLVEKLKLIADIDNLSEFSIEVDPRTTNKNKMLCYSKLGFTRISFGIQDFNPEVQKGINRVQPINLVEELTKPDIRKNFKGINFDLIVGMPGQTRESFRETINKVIAYSPDKISIGFLCYIPDLVLHQRQMDSSKIPSFFERTMMFLETRERLLKKGYVDIGIGHFAKSTDDLAIASKNKKIIRSAMAFAPSVSEDLIGIGPWAMGRISNYYMQNKQSVDEYCNEIQKENFPVFRGYILDSDEMARRDIITGISCFSSLDFKDIEKKYNLDFKEHFQKELELLQPYIDEGMLEMKDNGFILTEIGKFFQRHVCSCFDKFLNKKKEYRHSRYVESQNQRTSSLQ